MFSSLVNRSAGGARRQQLLSIAGPCQVDPASADLAPLIEVIRATHGRHVAGIVYYGSCFRAGDPYSGLVDFYVIVDRYRAVHERWASAMANRVLPPNVYYRECETALGTLRCKYAVLSYDQLFAGATSWFQSSIWGRFAQPLVIVYARGAEDCEDIRATCGAAVVTLLANALPAMAAEQAPATAFARALALSYGSELRVESTTRSGELVDGDAEEYARRFQSALALLAFAASSETADDTVRFNIAHRARLRARLIWPLRRSHGRALSVLRLAKACFTFDGAIDYAVWKVERHTGVAVAVTPRLRRYPLLFGWGVLWRLYRGRQIH